MKFQPSNPLPQLLLRMVLLMPLCMAFWWYLAQDYLLEMVRFLTEASIVALQPDKVLGILSQQRIWLLKTSLSSIDNPINLLGIQISTNRLTISYPLIWGLILATPDPGRLQQLLRGTLLIIPVSVLMALLLVQFKLALNINHQPILTELPQGEYLSILPYTDVQYYLMAVGRQVALLVLPTLAPVAIWLLLHRRFIQALIMEGVFSQLLTRRLHQDSEQKFRK